MYELTKQPWCNPDMLHENRLPVRACLYPFENGKAALSGNSSRVEKLSGAWAFRWFPSALDADDEVVREAADEARGYRAIQVPRSWQFAGYGRFLYTDEAYPFPLDPPYVPGENETGVYKRRFSVSGAAGAQYILRLEGAESCARVYVNGQYAGFTKGSRLPAEFDVTPLCRPGENDLCVVVHQYSDGTYLEDQDMWWLGGLMRDVFLITRMPSAVLDLIVDADYDFATGTGILRLRAQVRGGAARFRLLDDGGESLLACDCLPPDGTWTIPGVRPWSAEEPALYTLIVEALDASGREAEAVRQRVGFRRVEIVSGELRLNGRRLMLRGVNRHEFSPEDGRTVSYERTREDLLLMKKHFINAVRTSHYPSAPYFYDLCDALGLYVMDECDLETHGFEIEGVPTRLVEDPAWRAAYLDRACRTVGRDRNHASVILWSLGNESYWGSNLYAMYDWIRQEDPTRPVYYEGDRMSTHSDLTGTMYTPIGALHELDVSMPGKPHILCEFCHAMGNGPGSLPEYVELMEASRRIQGYFVWEWRDHGVRTLRPDGQVCYRYGGEFDEDYHSGNFCMDGLLAADSTPTPGFYAYAKAIEPFHVRSMDARAVDAVSRFAFRSVGGAVARFTLRRDGQIAEVTDRRLPEIAPGEAFSVPLPRTLTARADGNALWTMTAEFLLGEETFGGSACVLSAYRPSPFGAPGGVRTAQTGKDWLIEGDRFSLRVSFSDGRIHDYRLDGEALMPDGPAVDFFRAYLDNDRIPAGTWEKRNLHSMRMTVLHADCEETDGAARITLSARLGANARNWRAPLVIRYLILGDGSVRFHFEGRFEGDAGALNMQEVPRIGSTLRLDKSLQGVAYQGFGPDETYVDSRHNARKDVFRTTVDDMSFPYECPQDSGNRTGTDWIALYNGRSGLAFAFDVPRDVSAHNATARDYWKAQHACDVPRREFVDLHLDLINSGLGSGSCGPQHLKGYSAQTIPFRLDYLMTPFSGADPVAGARRAQDLMASFGGGRAAL